MVLEIARLMGICGRVDNQSIPKHFRRLFRQLSCYMFLKDISYNQFVIGLYSSLRVLGDMESVQFYFQDSNVLIGKLGSGCLKRNIHFYTLVNCHENPRKRNTKIYHKS